VQPTLQPTVGKVKTAESGSPEKKQKGAEEYLVLDGNQESEKESGDFGRVDGKNPKNNDYSDGQEKQQPLKKVDSLATQ